MRTLEKKGLEKMAKDVGLDLYKYIVGTRDMKVRPTAPPMPAVSTPEE